MDLGRRPGVGHPVFHVFRLMRIRLHTVRLSIVFMLVMAAGCAQRAPTPPPVGAGHVPGTHVVQRDETLYRIAVRHGLDWRDLARRNGIGPPYLIYPGQRLRLTGTTAVEAQAGRSPEAVAPRAAVSPPTPHQPPPPPVRGAVAPSPASAPAPVSTPSRPASQPAAATAVTAAAPQWQWPADGPIVRPFSNSSVTRRGIGIGGRRGDDVRAAAAGEVVYAGSGLVGYGRLIIVKHDARFISAYGHNEALLVREGERVAAGQKIALLGASGAESPTLHFEIRVDGTPVDPTRYLPRR
jgi:lipoprotein NlpD